MIEAKIDLSMLFKATITLNEGYGNDGGERNLKPRLIDADKFLYAEARYKTEAERDEIKERCGDASDVYFLIGDDTRQSFLANETPEEIDALIREAQDERAKRILKARLGIGIF